MDAPQPLPDEIELPPLRPAFSLSRAGDARWRAGRAEMLYRDLIPDRQGGRYIASQIRIPEGGAVPDYVHFHDIRFQLIFCHRGWVRVVYEDQGPPFVLQAGDCVLQPPRIRHRVLECSAGLEVVEVTCPAEHATHADQELELPTASLRPERDFGGQRFVRHQAAQTAWLPSLLDGFEERDIGVAEATQGLVGARVVRPTAPPSPETQSHSGELAFAFVLQGGLTLLCDGKEPQRLETDDAFVIPAGLRYRTADHSPDLECLEVSEPAELSYLLERSAPSPGASPK